ncbi:MAG: hypothetical protein MZV49_01340 [Rhodopseudomonas palustris]|nr:hypothetical protein [Rhodopseudomonas palustris]
MVDAIADSNAHMHGKKFAIFGDPDLVLRHGRVPARTRRRADHHPGDQRQQGLGSQGAGAARLLARSAQDCKVYAGKDLWHLRSLLFTRAGRIS